MSKKVPKKIFKKEELKQPEVVVVDESRETVINTGDTRYQINNMSKRIKTIQVHLTSFKKDFHSKLSLYKLVNKRKTFLKYLQRTKPEQYKEFIKTANIRISTTATSKY